MLQEDKVVKSVGNTERTISRSLRLRRFWRRFVSMTSLVISSEMPNTTDTVNHSYCSSGHHH